MTNPGKRIQSRIRDVLMKEWDPIGIRTEPHCADEYDAYIGRLYRLLAAGASTAEVADELHRIEAEEIGLGGRTPMARAQLLHVASAFRTLDVTIQ